MLREPGDTRPLSGSNTDCKLLAGAFRVKADAAIELWATPAQRGFVNKRCMLENVVEIEAEAIHASFDVSNRAALILFDFAAAFPSIARAYLWLVLSAIGISQDVVLALKALYASNHHYLSFCGVLLYAFCGAAGVRQGCPASTSLFVIATDPILRALCLRIPRSCVTRAYADDIALVLTRIWEQVPTVALFFK